MTIRDRAMAWPCPAKAMMLGLATAFVLLGVPGGTLAAGVSAGQSDQQIGPKFVVIPVEGMICISCAASVKRAIKSMEGVFHVEVNLENRLARVTYVPTKLSPDRIVSVINKLGYKAGAPRETQ